MTNASKVSFVSVLSLVVIASVLSFGAFAKIAHADDGGDYVSAPDYGGGDGNVGYLDLGYGGGNYVSAPDYSGNYVSAPNYSGDYVSAPDYSGDYVSAPDYAGDYVSAPDYGYTDYAPTDVYGNTVIDESGIGYSYNDYASGYSSYSTPSYATSYASAPFSFAAPSFHPSISYSTPQQPIVIQQPSRPVIQQQQQQQQQSQPVVINNNNTNTNTNTNVNTAPVYQTPVSYPVQYVYSQNYPTYYPNYNYPIYNNYSQPYCTITISYNGYNTGFYGNSATLTWSSSGSVTSAYISPNVGNVAPSGSMTVYTNGATLYTMGVSGPGGSANCQTQYLNNYNYTPQSYVSLSQIPYTGFDFGTFGNLMYWLSLLAFAIAGAYLMVYYRGGMLALATAAVSRSTKSAVAAPVKMVEATAKKIEQVVAPVFASMESLPIAVENATKDSMTIVHSKGSAAPRIVISRT